MGPPPNSGPPGPPPPHGGPPGGPPNPPDSGYGNRPHRPPYPPPVVQPWWWWQLQDQDDTYDDTDIQPPTCELLPHDVQAPPPFQYQNQTVTPAWADNLQQWGFSFGGKWHPLYDKGC